MIKISIIIATYNSEKSLKQTLDSIRYQTYKNIETIVVDGLSSDNTISIIEEYSDIVTKYISEEDSGIYNAFNKGINLSTGDYICFLGSDDCYINYNVIENIVYELNENVNVLSAPIFCVKNKRSQFFCSNKIEKEDILSGKMLPHPGLFVKSVIMKKYMFNEDNKIISDYEFLLRYILDRGNIKFINFPVVFFALGGISSNGFNSFNWRLDVYEHLKLYINLNMDSKYIFKYLNNVTKFESINNYKFNLFMLMINLLGRFKVLKDIKAYFIDKKEIHKCNLKYCRWCGRIK